MALNIYTNNYSLVAQNKLTTANSGVSKSIERLSSGLRINHASDDASGLAISEKLRSQIRGLSKASMNAQDAVSYLQTAEGGLEVIGDMLQRMRELAVQAGNGTYTSNDRAELQKEVDQLKEEINRIASSTEYNTKKLLTGDASALWSTNSADIEAIIRGNVAEGNYKLTVEVDPGQNAVYKTDVMTYKDDTWTLRSNRTNINGISVSGDEKLLDGATITTNIVDTTIDSASGTLINSNINGSYAGAVSISSGTTAQSGYVVIKAVGNSGLMSAGETADFEIILINALTGEEESLGVMTLTAGGTATLTLADSTDFTFVLGADAGNSFLDGDTFLFALTGEASGASGPDDAHVVVEIDDGNGGTITGPSVVIEDGQNEAGGSITVANLDKNGNVVTSTLDFTQKGNFMDGGTATITLAKAGTVADITTKLKDVGLFTNSDGRMLLDNTQTITLYGNNKSVEVTLEGDDTLEDLAYKLSKAIGEGLDMASTEDLSSLVQYVGHGEETAGGNGAVPGTFIIQGAILGSQSEIKFIGDEAVLNALSIANIQEAKNSDTTIVVTDAHTGKYIGEDKVSDNILRGIIQGADVKVDSSVGTEVRFDTATLTMIFTPDATQANVEYFLHLVDNRTEVQIGANEGQKFDISVAQMDTKALEIDETYVIDQASAENAITKFDMALTKVNSARATIGAQINRLEYTMQNLSVARENLTAAESRIRDLDVASESAEFAKNQILINSAVAMLAQANALPQIALQLIG